MAHIGASDFEEKHFGLEALGLCARRGHRLLFEKLDIRISPGEIIALRGANGAGKSTLLRILAGFMRPDSGVIRWPGAPDSEPQTLIHYLGHREGLRDPLSTLENLEFLSSMLGGERAAIPAALDRLGIARLATLPVGVLSAGQRRRVALARLLIVKRPFWLLDEPLATLDSVGQAIVTGLLAQHAQTGGLALVATHQALGIESGTITLVTDKNLVVNQSSAA